MADVTGRSPGRTALASLSLLPFGHSLTRFPQGTALRPRNTNLSKACGESLCLRPRPRRRGRRGEQRASSSTRPHCPLLPPSAGSWGGKPAPSRALAVCLQTWWRTWRRRLGRRSPRLPAKDSFYYFHDPRPLYLSLIFKTPINRENGANDAVRTQPEPCGAGPALESPHETRDTPAPAERCALLRGVSAGLLRGFRHAQPRPPLQHLLSVLSRTTARF